MATSRDDASTNILDDRRGAIDFAGDRDSLARLVRPFRRFSRPLVAIVVVSVTLAAAAGAGVAIWPDQPWLAGGAAGAVLLVAVVAGMCWWLAWGKRRAESANAAKTRLLAALGDDLRKPLRAIARAGAAIDRSAFDPDEWDKIARMRLDARAMLLQLEDIRTCLDIESGSFAPETRSFDLYRLANGVVASLRPPGRRARHRRGAADRPAAALSAARLAAPAAADPHRAFDLCGAAVWQDQAAAGA